MQPYQKHSQTSKEAANRNVRAPQQEAIIFALIASGGTQGMCAYELCNRTCIRAGTVSARLRGLELKGSIVKTKRTRTSPESNRAQSVYVTTAFATPEDTLKAKERSRLNEMEGILKDIAGRVERKGKIEIVWMDELYDRIRRAY